MRHFDRRIADSLLRPIKYSQKLNRDQQKFHKMEPKKKELLEGVLKSKGGKINYFERFKFDPKMPTLPVLQFNQIGFLPEKLRFKPALYSGRRVSYNPFNSEAICLPDD